MEVQFAADLAPWLFLWYHVLPIGFPGFIAARKAREPPAAAEGASKWIFVI
jgi:hypothetical protein